MLTLDEDNGQQKDGDLSAAKRNHILLLQRTYPNLRSCWRFGISLAFWDLVGVFGISLAFLGSRWRFWDLVGVFGISLVFGKIKAFHIHTHLVSSVPSFLQQCVTFRNQGFGSCKFDH